MGPPKLLADVAQLAEQLICNQQVAGSSPIVGSILVKKYVERFPSWPKGADCKSAGSAFGGSNPPLSTIKYYGPLAQLVEHLTLNQGVPGSNP